MTTPNLGLNELSATSSERISINTNWDSLDGLLSRVADADLNITDFPASPADGRTILLAVATGTALTLGLTGHLAVWNGSQWVTVAPTATINPIATTTLGYYVPNATLDGWISFDAGVGGGGSGDMTKAVYDTGDNGVVDNSEAVNGISITGTPSVGQVPTATSPTAATWQTPAPDTIGAPSDTIVRQTLTADLVLVDANETVHIIDPNGADRNVDIVPEATGKRFTLIVIGNTANILTIRRAVADGGATITTMADQIDSVMKIEGYYDGTDWIILAIKRTA